ncbi:hypothetical protein DENIS_3094 [Desulfonema ishimotonii]|uniref:DUF3396 domain-containing protein n=1 Tax=Desulfonema ishimotonii TaxID=45657 RepID=A0A401FYT5_9BACT|nr:type VI immunity family protein [Desulfonema ishimotonii]GBC62131.1 hypothetical protein DENIS_3094 [Desulfonema ishimotonii]
MISDFGIIKDPLHKIPILAVRPGIEVLLSLHVGDDPEVIWELWQYLTAKVAAKAMFVYDNRPDKGALKHTEEFHQTELREAFESACRGPEYPSRIDWASIRWADTDSADRLPAWSCSCTFGWISEYSDPRGCSLQVTVPFDWPMHKFSAIARTIAVQWHEILCWISVGFRFVPVCCHSRFFEESLAAIFYCSKRFLTIDVGDQLGLYTSFWQNQIRTVNWCTIVGPKLAALLPMMNVEQYTKTAGKSIDIEDIGNSRCYRADEDPSLGDINRGESALTYQLLDNELHTIRADGGVNFLSPWGTKSSGEWLRRWR